MQAREFIPLIDLAFLSLGAVVAILSQTQLVKSFAVEITEVGDGIAAVSRDEVTVITVAEEGLYLDGEAIGLEELAGAVDGRLALLRVDRRVPTEVLINVVGVLAASGAELRIEVEERASGS